MSLVKHLYGTPFHYAMHAEWRDRIQQPDGAWVWLQDKWNSNLIVDKIAPLISGLFKGEGTFAADPNIWFEVGTGLPAWDSLPDRGKSNENLADVALVTPNFRKQLTGAQIQYLDPTNTVVVAPQKKIQFTGRLEIGEAPVNLREFGLFGGNAAAGLGSGYMIDHIIHPKIDRTVSAPVLERLIRITF